MIIFWIRLSPITSAETAAIVIIAGDFALLVEADDEVFGL